MPTELLKTAAEVGVLLFSAWGAYNSQKMRAELLALKEQLKDWTYENFLSKDESKLFEYRLDKLEERPSNRATLRNVN